MARAHFQESCAHIRKAMDTVTWDSWLQGSELGVK